MLFEIRNPVLRTLAGIASILAVVVGIPYAAGLLGNMVHPPVYPEGVFAIWLQGWLYLLAVVAVAGVVSVLVSIGYAVGELLFGG